MLLFLLSRAHSKEEIVVGFDTEWDINVPRGSAGAKTALIQICLNADKCFLFHISSIGGE